MVSLAESSIVIYLWTIPLNSLLLSELDRVASVPGANATSGPRCRREQLFGFLARPAAVNTLRLKQPRH